VKTQKTFNVKNESNLDHNQDNASQALAEPELPLTEILEKNPADVLLSLLTRTKPSAGFMIGGDEDDEDDDSEDFDDDDDDGFDDDDDEEDVAEIEEEVEEEEEADKEWEMDEDFDEDAEEVDLDDED
jgi:hypothetical protein